MTCRSFGALVEGELAAALRPADPKRPDALTGTLTAKRDGDALVGTLRAAGPDGTVVRRAKVSLKRQK